MHKGKGLFCAQLSNYVVGGFRLVNGRKWVLLGNNTVMYKCSEDVLKIVFE